MQKKQNKLKILKIIYIPFLSIPIFGFIIYRIPFELIPDYLKLDSFERIYDLHNQILNALVTIFGLYISVTLIAHEIFKQKSGIALEKSLLINKINIQYISFLIISITFVFISSLLLPSKNLNHNELNIIYYNSYIFIVAILLFAPISLHLFKSLKPEFYIEDELNKLDEKSIFIRKIENDIKKQAELIENDPLEIITNVTLNLIEKKDNIQSIVIINNTTEKLGNLILNSSNETDKKYITERLISFYIKIVDYSLLLPNNSFILNSVFNSIESLYGLLVKKNKKITNLKFFTELFFNRYISRLFENNKEEIIIESIEVFQKIIELQIKNSLPKHDNIIILNQYKKFLDDTFVYPEHTNEITDSNIIWDEISNNLYDIFTIFIEKSIKYNKPDILNDCFEKINRVNSNLEYSKVSKYKRMFFNIKSAVLISDYTYQAFSENVYNKGSDAQNITPILLEVLIINESLSSRKVLQEYCNLLIRLQKIEKLDFWFLGGYNLGIGISEGTLGHIARRCIFNYEKNQNVKDCLDDCISAYQELKNYYELHPPSNIQYYYQLKHRLETMIELLNQRELKAEKLKERIKKIINTFKKKH